ncbi:uncharacterized protein BT62DRAFT_1013885 [Guyanagaster necrorhizus]|uniref:Uncharacterized protein n=1 Tax=Guyanagaster necrorhizus TaxID=856835 RepID=A0A9P7VFC3_9AGAR|nr:uncharacterized protein BT62DRAFT_1013885 [Guyanagaster necrorhizus MCA 3950]KAG7439510.1 hypothetical protein BT62DRAFT_1013885 [Guyanagaster necrorhizus MCA 3950]
MTITHADGMMENVPCYAKVQRILIGCVAVFFIVVTILGYEKHRSHFEKHKAAFEEGGEDDDDVPRHADPSCIRAKVLRTLRSNDAHNSTLLTTRKSFKPSRGQLICVLDIHSLDDILTKWYIHPPKVIGDVDAACSNISPSLLPTTEKQEMNAVLVSEYVRNGSTNNRHTVAFPGLNLQVVKERIYSPSARLDASYWRQGKAKPIGLPLVWLRALTVSGKTEKKVMVVQVEEANLSPPTENVASGILRIK